MKLFIRYLSTTEVPEYLATPIDLMSATKVPIILDEPDDWWTWSAYIRGLAKRRGLEIH